MDEYGLGISRRSAAAIDAFSCSFIARCMYVKEFFLIYIILPTVVYCCLLLSTTVFKCAAISDIVGNFYISSI